MSYYYCDNMEENKPPTVIATSKLKQAKLPFFKSAPVSVKTSILGQAKKRRNSGSNCLDSPTKSAKPGKPLNPIATDNTECQITKAHKIRKICNTKKTDGNDHEVSSSSEAEAGVVKSSSGKLDRFICKWSQDPHHEISSTNEMFEMCQQSELPSEDVKTMVDDNFDNLRPVITDVAIEPDCIVIEDTMDGSIEKFDAGPRKTESLETVKSEIMVSTKSEICSGEAKSLSFKDMKLKVAGPRKTESPEAVKDEPMASTKSEICSGEARTLMFKDMKLKVAGPSKTENPEAVKDEPMAPKKSEICSGEARTLMFKDMKLKVVGPSKTECPEAVKGESMAPKKSEICSEEAKTPMFKDMKLKVAGPSKTDSPEAVKDEPMSPNKSEICSEEAKTPMFKEMKLKVAEVNKEEFGDDKPCEDVVSDANTSVSENDTSITQEENLDVSGMDISIMSTACSTPNKSKDSDVSDPDQTADLSVSFPVTPASVLVTPATGSAKRRRKVGSGVKADTESTKLKKETERLERKRKLEAEKAEKERIKKEKKDERDKLKQELKEKLEKEKQEKERAKEEERKKREEEKMKREEEKKKKQAVLEAKQEEKRKKEEERKQKEEEKLRDEEDKKKKVEKTKQAFQSFFIKPKDNNVKTATPKSSTGMFIPFELKKDMHLAPAVRRDALTEDKKNNLDQTLANAQNCVNTYLEQLKNGEVKPHKTGRILRINPQPEEDDVQIVHDSEALKKVTYSVKILQFHTDYRPPYYGTWRKKPVISARNPWKKDESVFDYEVDSDEEWEEEEPGESLSCSDGEEEKGEDVDEDDDDGDGWMVPHGYLSEDEGCNEDDEITPEKLKLQQLAKAKAWEEDQKRKLRVAPAITVGCFFENSPSQTMTGDVRLLYEYKAVVLVTIPVQTSLFGCSEPEKTEDVDAEGVATTPSQKGFQKKSVPDEAMPDLIRLVHGNISGIKRLIREFRVYWLRKTNPPTNQDNESLCEKDEADDSFSDKNGDVSVLNESVAECFNVAESDVRLDDVSNNNEEQKKVREDGYGCSISKRQLELKIISMACREKRPGFNKICWYVHEKILTQFNMSDIKLPNSWVHILPVPARAQVLNKTADSPGNVSESQTPRAVKNIKVSAKSKMSKAGGTIEVTADIKDDDKVEAKETPLKKIKDQRSIKDFTRCKDEIEKNTANLTSVVNPDSLAMSSASAQQTPKNRKKPNAQKSIMEFTKKSGNRKKSLHKKCPPQVDNAASNQNSEIIYIDSDSAQGDVDSSAGCSKTVSCSEAAAPVISEVCTLSVVEPRNVAPSLEMSAPVVSNADSNEEPMEVDEAVRNTTQEETSVEHFNGADAGKKDDMKSVLTG